MSDGIWRSLDQPRHWKDVAKACELPSYSEEERSFYHERALCKDAQREGLTKAAKKISDILDRPNQGELFPDDHSFHAQLQEYRKQFAGKALACFFIDSLMAESIRGEVGLSTVVSSAAYALDARIGEMELSSDEHYCLKALDDESREEAKLHRTRRVKSRRSIDVDGLAQKILAGETDSQRFKRKTSVEDGPKL